MTSPPAETELATEILALYHAPLEEFISRRDALAKQLRAAKRQADAAVVKALRKPSRVAWTLDGVVHEDASSIDRLSAAIGEAQSGADLRAALEKVKDAVRAVSAVGARVAVRAGHPIEPTALAAAVHAIIGDANAFAEFRAGRLTEVPQGGGLDLLIALTSGPAPSVAPSAVVAPRAAASEPPKPDPRIELAAAARAEVHRSETVLAEVQERLDRAKESLRVAEARLGDAERALLEAQTEVDARRADVERTRQDDQSATRSLADAQRAFEEAQARLAEFE